MKGVSRRAFAKAARRNEALVRRAIARGYLVPLPDGTLDPAMIHTGWCESLRNEGHPDRRPGKAPLAPLDGGELDEVWAAWNRGAIDGARAVAHGALAAVAPAAAWAGVPVPVIRQIWEAMRRAIDHDAVDFLADRDIDRATIWDAGDNAPPEPDWLALEKTIRKGAR